MSETTLDSSGGTGLDDMDKVRGWLDGYKRYQLIHAAVRMQLFSKIANRGGITKEEAIEIFQVEGSYAKFFLQVLVDEGLLELQQGLYVSTDLSARLLNRESPAQIVDLFESVAESSGIWNDFEQCIRAEGSSVASRMSAAARYQQYAPQHMEIVKRVVGWARFTKSQTLLEISNPASLHAVGICRRSPVLKGTVLCDDSQVEVTSANIGRFNLAHRIDVRTGQLPEMLPAFVKQEAYDIVVVAHALYPHRKALVPFLQAVAEVMRPGGLLVLDHYYCSPDCGEALSGLRELDQALSIGFHPLCNAERFASFVEMAGFKLMETADVYGYGGNSQLFVAVKDGSVEPETHLNEDCCSSARSAR